MGRQMKTKSAHGPSSSILLTAALVATIAATLVPLTATAFEDTKVMPAGVRRLSLRLVTTNIDEKTNGAGQRKTLAAPLEKELKFKDILKGEKNLTKRALSDGFFRSEGIKKDDSVGSFTADVKSRVSVYAPVFTYGLNSRYTLAAALPVYNMAVSVDSDFNASSNGQRFVNTLSNSKNNQRVSASDATRKINDAVSRLNTKLSDNGYRPLENWEETGLGDLTLLGKWRALEGGPVQIALTQGVVAPTGRRDNPDNLLDKGFGDGQWDIFGQAAFDQPFGGSGVFLNQYAKYTWQLPDQKQVRLVTADETIEVPKQKVGYKLGDKIDAGSSLQFSQDSGFATGAGYNFYTKLADTYKVASATKAELERDTFEQSHQLEFEVGYSSVPAYRRGEVKVPFETKLNYRHQLRSKNLPVTNLFQLDTGVFF